MGFETLQEQPTTPLTAYLNFIPMGFETCFIRNTRMSVDIWTLSLWDLKLLQKFFTAIKLDLFELYPYGIWNTLTTPLFMVLRIFELYPYGIWNQLKAVLHCSFQYLNFIPMGFETSKKNHYHIKGRQFELYPYGIWNLKKKSRRLKMKKIWTLSLWDLKRNRLLYLDNGYCNLNFIPMGFETSKSSGEPIKWWIWTLSLWDLKPMGRYMVA